MGSFKKSLYSFLFASFHILLVGLFLFECRLVFSETTESELAVGQIRLGVFAHNQGLIASKVESGMDLNVELTLPPTESLWDAEPSAGLMLNNQGHTSFLYGGLSWEIGLLRETADKGLFLMPFLGLAVHNGEKEPKPDRRGIGCRILFREAIEVCWRFSKDWAVAVQTGHLSHGGFCSDRNQGLDNSGLRFHWRL